MSMEPLKSDDATLSKWLPGVLLSILAVAVVALVIELIFYRYQFGGGLSASSSTWGEFGDFVGGTLGAAYSLLGLLALLLTLYLQNREFSHSIRALNEQNQSQTLQRFENTFFEMVRLHHEIVKALDLRDRGNVTTAGRDCFGVFYDRFASAHSDANGALQDKGQLAIAQRAYNVFYSKHQHEIGHYFRNFYRILKFIDESEVHKKDDYTGILRAQMSSPELALLFYNALHPIGTKMRPLVERYEMLENLEVGQLRNPPDEVVLIGRSAFGDQDLSRYGI